MREVHPIALVLAKRSHFTLWSPADAFRPAEFLGYSDSLMAFKTVEALSSYVDRDEDPAIMDANLGGAEPAAYIGTAGGTCLRVGQCPYVVSRRPRPRC